MSKSQLYRVCIKSGTFQEAPTFRIKIGRTQKKINPYFIASDKQRYNCDSILERKNQQPELILSCFFGYRFIGSGSIKFDKSQMPNQRVQIFNRDQQSIGFIDCSLMKIDKVVQVPALTLVVKSVRFIDPDIIKLNVKPFLVLKYGELNYQTLTEPEGEDQQFDFDQTFRCPQSEMERILVETWCEIQETKRFLGVSLIYLREKDDINGEKTFDMLFMNKKRGDIRFSVTEDKAKLTKKVDYSNAPKRTIKTTVVEALITNSIKKGSFIKLSAGGQQFNTTGISKQGRQLKWNQSFTMQVNSIKQELTVKMCLPDSSQDQFFGRAFLETSKVGNRKYQLTLLNEKQLDVGKVYLQFYDHDLDIKQFKKKVISKQLADKISSDLQGIKNRYNKKEPLHDYMQSLHAVLEEGLIKVSKMKSENPLRDLGKFLIQYKK